MTDTQTQGATGKAVYTPQELAVRWGYHVNTIYSMIEDGRLYALPGGRRKKIPAREVMRLEGVGGTGAPATSQI
jgi:excisionase family DNA binding protein